MTDTRGDTATGLPRPVADRGRRRSDTRRTRRITPALYYRQVVAELRKVIWPTRKDLVTYTTVVLVFVVIITAIVAGLDIGFAKLALEIFG